MLSEATSIPRMADAAGVEFLALSPGLRSGIIPEPDKDGFIRLPDPSSAPLFVLLALVPVASRSNGSVHLSFYIDDAAQLENLPNIDRVMRALVWLVSRVPIARDLDVRIAWLGLPNSHPSMGGATGTGTILANYRRTSDPKRERPTVPVIIAAIPLFEAVHVMRGKFHKPAPRWVEESLITYLGLVALAHENPHGEGVVQAGSEFVAKAKNFPLGLLENQRLVESGDYSKYGAFF